MRAGPYGLVFAAMLSEVAFAAGWVDHLKLRQTMFDMNYSEEPAQMSAVFPDEGPNTYSIDMGVSYQFPISKATIEIGPMVELHKNTNVDEPQDTFLAGVTSTWLIGDVSKQVFVAFLDMSATYKDDKQVGSEGGQASVTMTPLIRCKGLPMQGATMGGKQFQWLLQPNVGLEYENTTDAGPGEAEGSRLRGIGEIKASFYPGAASLGKRLILEGVYAYRRDLRESSGLDDSSDNHYLRTGSITYYHYFKGREDKEQGIGFGIDYSNGENPSIGLSDQEYTRLSFKIKL